MLAAIAPLLMFEGTSETEEMGGFTLVRWFLFDPGSNFPRGICLHPEAAWLGQVAHS